MAARLARAENLLEEMRGAVIAGEERERTLTIENEALLAQLRGGASGPFRLASKSAGAQPGSPQTQASLGERLRSHSAAAAGSAKSVARRLSQVRATPTPIIW